jgi:cytochrome c biogenesis protein CcmG/thiol:disulfide interchange protein DsbE
MNRYLLPIGVFAALVALLAIGLGKDPRRVPSPFIGKPAPAFDLPQLEAPERRFTSDLLRGRPVLLNVWASWCVECRHEHALLMQLATEHGIPIYGLNYKDPRDDALAWLRDWGNPYLVTGADRDGRVGIEYGVYGVPETFVIDAQGIIRHKHIGALTEQAIRDVILPLLDPGIGRGPGAHAAP